MSLTNTTSPNTTSSTLPLSHRIGFGAFAALAIASGVLAAQAPAARADAMAQDIAQIADLTDAEMACATPKAVADMNLASMQRPGPQPTVDEARTAVIANAIAACT